MSIKPSRSQRTVPGKKTAALKIAGQLRHVSERFAQSTLDALSARIAVLDETGSIIAVNRSWRDFAKKHHPQPAMVCEGANYFSVCDAARGGGAEQAATFAAAVRRLLGGEQDEFSLEYPCHSPDEKRWFNVRVTRFTRAGAARVVVAHEAIMDRMPAVETQSVGRDIGKRKQAEQELRASREQLRAMASHCQTAREEERTNVAREIHDVLAQELTRLKIDLAWIERYLAPHKKVITPETLLGRVSDMRRSVDSAIDCVKKIATGLRPAVLDSLGLCATVEWQAREFQSRTGHQCRADVPAEEIVRDRDTATAIFRILQEALTNVSRHSNATQVNIRLKAEDGLVLLSVRDNGRGISPDSVNNPMSIGLAGMRERAQLLGGYFEIQGRPGSGTTIEVRIPLKGKENPRGGS